MTCKNCEERRQKVRDAWIEGRIAEAVRQIAIGAGEIARLKPKERD